MQLFGAVLGVATTCFEYGFRPGTAGPGPVLPSSNPDPTGAGPRPPGPGVLPEESLTVGRLRSVSRESQPFLASESRTAGPSGRTVGPPENFLVPQSKGAGAAVVGSVVYGSRRPSRRAGAKARALQERPSEWLSFRNIPPACENQRADWLKM